VPVAYGVGEAFPLLSVVFTCGCGARQTRHGTHAADPPPGWVRVDEIHVACPGCALAAKPPAHGPA
jgi:hypothetical protein